MIKIGFGLDTHGFTEGESVILGGVKVPHHMSVSGHSDGDVLLHAIVDALLGASTQGDIGVHFPSSDPQWQGVSSSKFLKHAKVLLEAAGATINHIDCTIVLQEPVISPFILKMRSQVAEYLGIDLEEISIKATTSDHLGFVGRKEGVTAMALATLEVPQ